ncbi:NADH:ubiquinone reductase (H(+)-translocating) [Trifolium repens]|nr:NADH:ubiquinone reductase (H(+)-translocating) [Trifolium repens]
MASSSSFLNRTCMILPRESNPTEFAKDQRPYKYDELNVAIENPVDLESIRVNGFAEVVHLYKRQGLEYYFDLLNGPTYTELVKEFWMKASVITRDVYNRKVREKIEENPKLQDRTPEEMGLRSFVSTEIESFVAGFRISIRLCHILEALKLKRDGLVLRHTDEAGPDVEEYIFKPKANPKDKFEWTNNCKIIYRILIDSVLPKLGGTDQISSLQKLFTFHVAKGNFVDVGKLIFDHLCVSIISSKAIVRHSRLLSHMFAQCGLLDAIIPYLPGLGSFLLSSKIVNSTTLRYLKLVKNNEIVHPTHPLLLRNSEKGIGECWLIHVSDSEAKRVIEAHAEFMNKLGADVGDGQPTKLTVRQTRLLEQPLRLELVKRKAAKSPAGKKAAKTQKTTAPRSSKKPRARKVILEDLTEEEKEEAVVQAALAKVAEFNKKQEALKDGYDCGIEESAFDDMYKKLPKRNDPHNLLEQQTLYGNETGKFSTFIGGSSAFSDYFRRLQFPSEIRVKHAFDKILKGVNSEKVNDLSENQPSSEQFNLILSNPSESQANFICNDAAQASTSTAPTIQPSIDEDSDKTPSPPPQKSPNHQEIPTTTPQPEEPQNDPQPNSENVQPVNTQEQPTIPQPENTQPENTEPENTQPENTQPENEIPPEHTPSEHDHQKSPEPDQDQVSETLHSNEHVHEKSPHHVAVDNSCDLSTPIKKHVQHINETLNLEIAQKTPPDQSQHLKHLMQDLSMDCIFFPPHLPSRIANEPLDQTQDDITSLLKAVDKNLRRMSSAIPHRSIDTAHIDKECDLMEQNLVLRLRSVRKAYTTDLNLRNEIARKEEEERRERERLEAEEREKKRLEDERIER